MERTAIIPTPGLVMRRLAETIAWCRLKGSPDDPRNSLRTSALRPTNLALVPNKYGSFDYEWGTAEQLTTVLQTLAEKRVELLTEAGIDLDTLPLDLSSGRLLFIGPEDSDWCGLSEPESDGFIDAIDIPAWDTWICYVSEPLLTREDNVPYWTPSWGSYLLCWVPNEFVELVEIGILVNPVKCFFWASEYKQQGYDTKLLRWLDAEGFFR